jgi:hypothetical protein
MTRQRYLLPLPLLYFTDFKEYCGKCTAMYILKLVLITELYRQFMIIKRTEVWVLKLKLHSISRFRYLYICVYSNQHSKTNKKLLICSDKLSFHSREYSIHPPRMFRLGSVLLCFISLCSVFVNCVCLFLSTRKCRYQI